MSEEANMRWRRDQWQAKKLATYLAALSLPLWAVSYQVTGPIYTMPQWQWFAAVSVAFLLGALGCSIGSAVAVGFVLTNERPLPESNY